MLSLKHLFITLGLLLALTGMVAAQSQQKKQKDREVLSTGPKPVVQLSDHPASIRVCAGSEAAAQIPLTATVTNFSTTPLRYTWRANGGRLTGDGPNATWDLSGATPGTYTARVEVDNNRDDGCAAFTSTKIVVRECPPPPPVCPAITVSGPETVPVGAPATFTASVNGGTPGAIATYNWSVTGGTIVGGQGTNSITVDTAGLAGQTITANLSVGGYTGLNCQGNASLSIPRKISSILVDNYPPLKYDDEKARLDNFAIQMQNDPSAKGYIIAYGGPRSNAAEKQKRLKRAVDYLTATRGIDANRIVTLEGASNRDQPTTELWIVPLGAEPPNSK